jgi:hypothetical protein
MRMAGLSSEHCLVRYVSHVCRCWHTMRNNQADISPQARGKEYQFVYQGISKIRTNISNSLHLSNKGNTSVAHTNVSLSFVSRCCREYTAERRHSHSQSKNEYQYLIGLSICSGRRYSQLAKASTGIDLSYILLLMVD